MPRSSSSSSSANASLHAASVVTGSMSGGASAIGGGLSASARRISLTRDLERAMQRLASDLESDLQTQFEHYQYRCQQLLDPTHWKLVKTREQLKVFRARDSARPDRRDESEAAYNVSSALALAQRGFGVPSKGPQAAMWMQVAQPLLLVTGTIPGTVDDVMYAINAQDSAALRERAVYHHSNVTDAAVMATIEDATLDDPYRFHGLQWLQQSFPGIGGLVKARDFVVMTRTQLSHTTRGERIGLWTQHSVESSDVMPSVPESGMVRGRMTMAALFRQQDVDHVQVFMLTLVDLRGQLSGPMTTSSGSTVLHLLTNLNDAMLHKKLAWHVRHGAQRKPVGPAHAATPDEEEAPCASCGKRLGGLFSGGSYCHICKRMVCSKCRVHKTLVLEAETVPPIVKPFEFCVACMLNVQKVASIEMARREFTNEVTATATTPPPTQRRWDQPAALSTSAMPPSTSSASGSTRRPFVSA